MIRDVSPNMTKGTKKRPAALLGRRFDLQAQNDILQNSEESAKWWANPGVTAEIYVPVNLSAEKRRDLFVELSGDLRRILIDGVTEYDDDDEIDE